MISKIVEAEVVLSAESLMKMHHNSKELAMYNKTIEFGSRDIPNYQGLGKCCLRDRF